MSWKACAAWLVGVASAVCTFRPRRSSELSSDSELTST